MFKVGKGKYFAIHNTPIFYLQYVSWIVFGKGCKTSFFCRIVVERNKESQQTNPFISIVLFDSSEFEYLGGPVKVDQTRVPGPID